MASIFPSSSVVASSTEPDDSESPSMRDNETDTQVPDSAKSKMVTSSESAFEPIVRAEASTSPTSVAEEAVEMLAPPEP